MVENDFPKKPDWRKVRGTTSKVMDLFDKLTYTEKVSVLQMVKTTIDADFILSMIQVYNQDVQQKAQAEFEANKPPHYQ